MKKLWDFISNLGYNPGLTYEEIRRIKLLSRLNFITFLVLLFYFIVNVSIGIHSFLLLLTITMFCLATNLFLLHKKIYTPAKHFSIVIIAFCIGFFVLFNGDTFSEAFFIPLVAMPLIVFKEKKVAVFYLIALIFLIVVLKINQASFESLTKLGLEEMMLFKTMNVACAALITYFLTFYFKAANEEYESALVKMNGLISEKNKEITDSIEYAKYIQNGLLPSAAIINACLPDSFIYYKPKDIVAGDFYWLERKNEYIIFSACDCTGHGVPGAMVSVICSNALNRAVKEFNLLQPGEILTKVRELVLETFEKGENEVKDGMDVSLCAWNKKTNELLWAGANNPLWYIQNKQLKTLSADKQPIGKIDNPKPFTTHKVQLRPGDCIYVFTDGYADQFGGAKGKKFKYKQLQELLLANSDKSLDEQQKILSKTLDDWKGKLEQIDDVLIMGIRV
jgi:serine phosphatase RsbU (regulator of sigma subunit)